MFTKRFFSFLLALVLLLACVPLTAVTANAANTVNLTVWADEPARDWVLRRAQAFNAQSSKWTLNVTFEACHVGESGNIILADPEGAADVFVYANDMVGALVQANALLPVTGSALDQVKSDNSATMVDTVTHANGKVYGIPYTSNTYFMYYNKNVYSESDVKSLETMLKKGKVAFPLDNTWYLPAFYYANGCTMFGTNGNNAQYGIDFSAADGVAVTKYLAKLVKNPNFKPYGAMSIAQSLITGQVDAFFSGAWEANTMKEAFGNNYGAAQLPTVNIDGKTVQLKAFVGSKAYGVNAHTDHPEAAMAFAAFLGNTTSQLQRYELFNDIPAAPALANNTSIKSDPVAVAQIRTVDNTSVTQPTIAAMSNYWNSADVLSDKILSGTVTDENAKDVMAEIGCVLNGGLCITAHPKGTTVDAGQKVSVSVEACGNDLTYQWYIKNAGQTKYSKSSITSSTYTTTMSSAANGRSAYCVVTNKDGESLRTKATTLKMSKTDLELTTQPKNTYVKSGEIAKLTVAAKGDGLKYQWYIKNAGQTKYSKSSVTSDTYSCKMSNTTKDRLVYCVVTDAYGNEVKSKTVILREKVSITAEPSNTYVKAGVTAKITVKASGDGLKYQWYIKNAGQTKYSKSSITSATYSCKLNSTSKDRLIYCIVTDAYGNTVISKTVILREAASITQQPQNAAAASGKTASTTVKASGDGLKYQWYIKNAGQTKFSKSSVTSATYSCKMSTTSNNRQAYCVITDKYGKTVKTNTITLKLQ